MLLRSAIAGIFAAVLPASAGDQHRPWPIADQAWEARVAVDVVQSQLDQLGALLDQVPMFGDHVLVAAAANTDAYHGRIRILRIGNLSV